MCGHVGKNADIEVNFASHPQFSKLKLLLYVNGFQCFTLRSFIAICLRTLSAVQNI